jgi:hypothetical protein
MSWPPLRASHPRDLGAPPVADVVQIDRRGDTALSCNVVLHSQVRDPALLWKLIADAAVDADASRATTHAHTFLFEHLDPGLVSKSAAVKLVAQALALKVLCDDGEKLGSILKEWLNLAKVVAHGMHLLFDHGCKDWDYDFDSSGRPIPSARRDAWFPFEWYDRATGFSNCFGDSEAHRLRSRIARADACPATQEAWSAALEAHQKMLRLEARHALFDASSDDCRLSAAEVGGLFLLTHVADFLGKRTDVFDGCFWLLRAVHFGIERNVVFKMTEFRFAPPCDRERRRTSSPDPTKSHCWLTNALDTLVALKVLIFYKLRIHAFDRLEEKATLTTDIEFSATVHVSRHDLEESKSHWLPSKRIAKTDSKRVKRQRVVDDSSRDQRVVPLRQAFARMSEERFKLRRRLQALDRMRGILQAVERRRSSERAAMEEEAIAEIAALNAQDEHRRSIIVDSFSMDKLPALVEERVRHSVLAEGILILSSDSIWNHTELDAVVGLAALETPRLEDLVVRVTRSDWQVLVDSTATDGHAFEESISLVTRLLALSLCERDYRNVASLKAMVRLPAECRDGVALDPEALEEVPQELPAHVRRYEELQKEEALRRGMMVTFVRTTSKAMGHAITTCLKTCIAVLDGTASSPTAFEMPARLFASGRDVAISVVHRFMAIAAHFGGLMILVDETVEVHDGTPILIYDVTHQSLRMPVATSVVTRHWAAARHLLALALAVEPWTRDARRRPPDSLLLPPDQCWVTWSTEGLQYHDHNRDVNARLLEDAEESLGQAYWPRWPPSEHDVVSDGCMETALRFGRFAGCDALATLQDCRACVKRAPYT